MPVRRFLMGDGDAVYRSLHPRAEHQGSERASEAAAEVACAPDRPPQHIVALPAEKQVNDGMGEAMEGVTRRNDWPQGVAELEAARERGCWQDGRPIGRGFASPCLKPGYASLIAAGVKPAEGGGAAGGRLAEDIAAAQRLHQLSGARAARRERRPPTLRDALMQRRAILLSTS